MKKVDFEKMCREYEIKRDFIHLKLRIYNIDRHPRKHKEYSEYYNYLNNVVSKLNNISFRQYESRARRIHDYEFEEKMNKKNENFAPQLNLFYGKW